MHLANALSNPGAMVVEPEYTVVANGAMRTPGWAVEHARVTVLCLHRDAINNHIFRARQPQTWGLSSPVAWRSGGIKVVFGFRRMSIARDNSWISSRRQ